MASPCLQTVLDHRDAVVNRKGKGMALKELTFWLEEISQYVHRKLVAVNRVCKHSEQGKKMQRDWKATLVWVSEKTTQRILAWNLDNGKDPAEIKPWRVPYTRIWTDAFKAWEADLHCLERGFGEALCRRWSWSAFQTKKSVWIFLQWR